MRRPVYKSQRSRHPVTFFMVLSHGKLEMEAPLVLARPVLGEGRVWVDVHICGFFSGTRPDLSQGVLRRSAMSYDA